MKPTTSRRDFVLSLAAAAVATRLGPALPCARAAEPGYQTTLHKALIMGRPNEEELRKLKDAGFEGVEAVCDGGKGGLSNVAEAETARVAADKAGKKIHSELRGWAEFNSADPTKVETSRATTETALKVAQVLGADAVLLVPCRVGGVKMPKAWEFLPEWSEPAGHLTRVVQGDNGPYADYLRVHNHAIDTSREAVQGLIPVAEKTGVVIALENVWNNLWVSPALFRHFVASFRSPWVKAYFDIGNHVKYAPPEQWILTLGALLAKVHVKDFKLNPADADGGGDFVNIRDGSVRWPVVRAALDRAGYNGWMTIEGGNLSLAEHSQRLDLIVAGK
jgi:hexulose-6-phosphate isomerase